MSRLYRVIFAAHNGPGPWPCWFCDSDVVITDFVVHHVNHDRSDDSPTNLVAAHDGCHALHHSQTPRKRYPVASWVQKLGVEAAHQPEVNARRAESLRRSYAEGRRLPKRKAVCKRGHDRTDPSNIYVNPGTSQEVCRACMRIWQVNARKRKVA